MVSESKKRQLREAAAAEFQTRWGAVRPEAMHEVAEDLRARVVEEGSLHHPAEAVAAVKQSLAAHTAWGQEQAPRSASQELSRGQEHDAGFDR